MFMSNGYKINCCYFFYYSLWKQTSSRVPSLDASEPWFRKHQIKTYNIQRKHNQNETRIFKRKVGIIIILNRLEDRSLLIINNMSF